MQKTWTSREFTKLLKRNGYEYSRCSGDHMIYKRDGRTISFNVCGKRGLNRMVAQRLIKEYGLIVA